MSEQDIAQLKTEFLQKKREVTQLRAQLSTLNNEKEEAFRNLRSLRDKIKARVLKIKQFKDERDSLTKEVQGLKKNREELNSAVKEKATVRKDVEEKKNQLNTKSDPKDNPSRIKHEIAELEQKIETEV